MPAPGVTGEELADAAQLSSLADETPEGRSIVVLAKEKYKLRGRDLAHEDAVHPVHRADAHVGRRLRRPRVRKGAGDAIERFVAEQGGAMPAEVRDDGRAIAKAGGTPLVVADDRACSA